MPSIARFCTICGQARDGQYPFCIGCGRKYEEPASAPAPARDMGAAVERVASAVSAAQSAASSAASAVRGAENLARMVLDGTPPPAWHVVIGETIPSVEQILAQKLVTAVQEKVVSAVQRTVVDRAAPSMEPSFSGQRGRDAPTPAGAGVNAPYFCNGCGVAISVDARFCLNCGKPHHQEASLETSAAALARGQVRVCPRCSATLVPGWRFCVTCGNPVAAP
jgi:hypothetical protein